MPCRRNQLRAPEKRGHRRSGAQHLVVHDAEASPRPRGRSPSRCRRRDCGIAPDAMPDTADPPERSAAGAGRPWPGPGGSRFPRPPALRPHAVDPLHQRPRGGRRTTTGPRRSRSPARLVSAVPGQPLRDRRFTHADGRGDAARTPRRATRPTIFSRLCGAVRAFLRMSVRAPASALMATCDPGFAMGTRMGLHNLVRLHG
jgi:hypothetical protein